MNFLRILPLLIIGFALASCVADNAYKATPKTSKSSVTAQKTLNNKINYPKFAKGSFKVGKPYSQKGQTFVPNIELV
jgi:hypothetical protein